MAHDTITTNTPPPQHRPARPIAGSWKPEDFERLARTTLTLAEWDELKNILGSLQMRSRIMNNPPCATAQQVVALAALLGASPWALHWGFGLGADKVSYEEALMWWLIDEMRANTERASENNILYEQTQKALREELPVVGLVESATLLHTDNDNDDDDKNGSHDKAPARRLAAAAG